MTRICGVQMASVAGDPEGNLSDAEEWIRSAVRQGASLVVFPEQFATAWSPQPQVPPEALEGPIVTRLRGLAQAYSVAILGSFVEKCDQAPKNTCVAIDRYGEISAVYSKMHLFSPGGEDRHYTPGDSIATFTVGNVTFGIAICYDLRFHELFRLYARRGVDCMLVPAAWPCTRVRHWRTFLQARAVEHQFFVAGINAAGTGDPESPCGRSWIAGPDGQIIGDGGTEEGLVCADIDPERVREVRSQIPVEADRRDDLYRRLSGT